MDSGSSTPSSMVPSAGASPRRFSSFGTKAARISEEGGRLLRRASEAAGIAEVGSHIRASETSGDSSPDEGNACCYSCSHTGIARQRLCEQSAWLLTFLLAIVPIRQKVLCVGDGVHAVPACGLLQAHDEQGERSVSAEAQAIHTVLHVYDIAMLCRTAGCRRAGSSSQVNGHSCHPTDAAPESITHACLS